MDISVQPDIYTPSVDNNGNYIDSLLSFNIQKGIYCPCMPNKERVFNCSAKFNIHKKSKAHQKWLSALNHEKMNYFVENVQLKELVENQRKIISQLDIDNQNKKAVIEYINNQLKAKILSSTDVNLLDFD